MKKTVLIYMLLLFGFSIGCKPRSKSENSEKKKDKPNILFIFADDQAYSTIHSLGNDEIITPNLDRLMSSGVAFTHAYNMGGWGGAVSMASRAMLNTGRFLWEAQEYENNQEELVAENKMWGQIMQSAGYETYMTGKWHVKTDATESFNHVVHVREGMPLDARDNKKVTGMLQGKKKKQIDLNEVLPIGYNRPLNVNDTAWQPWDKKFGGYWEGGKHWSEVLGDDAIAFIDSAQTRDKPFFMYLAFNAPHDPRQSPKEYVDMYPLENISVPEAFLPEYPYRGDSIGHYFGQRDESLAPFPRTEYAVKVNRQEYYAIITHMDHQIGRILDALEKSGKADNTYIFFTADHGLAVGNHGFMGKQNLYDHSIRVPLIMKGPGVPKNKKIETDVYLQDIMATSIDLSGLEKPEYIDFNSLMPFIKDEKKESFYPSIYGAYRTHHRMIREDGFKLIVYPRIKVMRLYNLNTDPLEMNDLAQKPEYQEKTLALYHNLLKLQKEMNDPMDLTKYFPDI